MPRTRLDPRLRRVVQAHRAVERTQRLAADAQARRVAEIQEARRQRIPYRLIAEAIGVSSGRVAQLERAEETRGLKREDNREAKARERAERRALRDAA